MLRCRGWPCYETDLVQPLADGDRVSEVLRPKSSGISNADMAAIARKDDRGYYHPTNHKFSVPLRIQSEKRQRHRARIVESGAVQIPDVLADPKYAYSDMQTAARQDAARRSAAAWR